MPRNIPADTLKYLYLKQATVLSAYAFSITGTDSHKYVCNNEDVGGYTALAIKRTPIRTEEGTIINEVEVGLDNADLGFRTMVMNGSFDNVQCKIQTMFSTTFVGTTKIVDLYHGFLDAPKGDDHWVNFTIRPYPILEREFPKRIYQSGCNWSFCDSACGLTLGDYDVSTTLSAESDGTTLTCSHGQAADYFLPGFVKITSGDYDGEYRPILTNTTSALVCRVGFGHTIPSGTSIMIQKLCAKIPDACENTFANYAAYGGFPFIPNKPIL